MRGGHNLTWEYTYVKGKKAGVKHIVCGSSFANDNATALERWKNNHQCPDRSDS